MTTPSGLPLDSIGFYTLSDERAEHVDPFGPLHRCELVLTSACNFACPYCRGMQPEDMGTTPKAEAMGVLDYWVRQGLRAVRFSGGEPTLVHYLPDLVRRATEGGATHVAISTNGSAPRDVYDHLLGLGVNDVSVSLDGCCASTCSTMAGGGDWFDIVAANIQHLSSRVYTTVGVVLTDANVGEVERTVAFASSLGVADIRIISAAQTNAMLQRLTVPEHVLAKHPILRYRYENIKRGRHVRGIRPTDCRRCPLVLDDMAVLNGKHYPCVIYMREWGDLIGDMGSEDAVRASRLDWFALHDTHADPICLRNCLDVCVDHNNRVADLNPKYERLPYEHF